MGALLLLLLLEVVEAQEEEQASANMAKQVRTSKTSSATIREGTCGSTTLMTIGTGLGKTSIMACNRGSKPSLICRTLLSCVADKDGNGDDNDDDSTCTFERLFWLGSYSRGEIDVVAVAAAVMVLVVSNEL